METNSMTKNDQKVLSVSQERNAETFGYAKTKPLLEGYLRKGGINPPSSQTQVRPPPPPPMRVANPADSAMAEEKTRP